MPDTSEKTAKNQKIQIINAFEDEGDTVVYYLDHSEKKKHAVVSREKKTKEDIAPGTVVVITAMEKESMCDTKMTYIDHHKIDPECFDMVFQNEGDVVWLKKKIYIPVNVTRWTFTITYKGNANPHIETHSVTIGEEKPGT